MGAYYAANPPTVKPQQQQQQGQQPGGQSQNFAQMQQQGQARPSSSSMPYANWAPGSQANIGQAPPQTPPTQNPGGTTPPPPTPNTTSQPVLYPGGPATWNTPQGHSQQPSLGIGNSTQYYPGGPNGSYPGGAVTAPSNPQTGAGQPNGQAGASTAAQGTANQIGGATQNLLLNQLQNPNPYSSPMVQQGMQSAQTQVNEQLAQGMAGINQNLASRGVYDSSLAGGYLQDANTAAGRQLTNVATQLLPAEAAQYTGAQSAALGNSNQYSQSQFGNSLATANLNDQEQQQQTQNLLSLLGLTGT